MVRRFRILLPCALLLGLVYALPADAKTKRVHRLHLSHHTDPNRAFHKKRTRRLARTSLATTWDCVESTADRAPLLSNAPQVKVIYAYPAGATKQLTTYANKIQNDAATVRARVAAESGNAKTIRFDVGGSGNAC